MTSKTVHGVSLITLPESDGPSRSVKQRSYRKHPLRALRRFHSVNATANHGREADQSDFRELTFTDSLPHWYLQKRF